jgi:hypothetical protein
MEAKRQPGASGPELLDAPPATASGLCLGTLVSAVPGAGLRVVYPGPDGWDPVEAHATVVVTPGDVGRQVVLAFPGDPRRPVVLGVLQPNPVRAGEAPQTAVAQPDSPERQVRVDGRAVEIEAERELVLRCGKSSITLRAGGDIVVKGMKIVSRARTTNKIKGGNVLIN